MRPDVLQAALTSEQRSKGYCLKELDDHTVELRHRGAFVAYWSQTGATIAEIRAMAEDHMALKGG